MEIRVARYHDGKCGSPHIWRDLIAGVDPRPMIYRTASAALAVPVLFVASVVNALFGAGWTPGGDSGTIAPPSRGIDITSKN